MTSGSAGARPALHALTSLRFFAAFAVVVLHYRELLGPLPEGVRQVIVGGQFGVTFFFVLSGFILTYRYREWFADGVSDARFWWFQRFRLARIYPVYLLGLLLDTPWHLLERASVGQLGEVAQTYWASWLLNAVALQAWVPAVPFAMFWNTPAWSVAAEFFFYATFPWLCAALCRSARSWAWTVAAMLFAVVLGAVLYAVVIHAMNYVWHVDTTTQYLVITYNPLLRYSEFLAGCLAGHGFLLARNAGAGAVLHLRTAGRRHLLLGVCLLVVVVRVMVPGYSGPSAALWLLDVSTKYAVFILPFVGLIFAVASGPTCLSPVLEHRWLVLLGEASYSLYIVHWFVVTVLSMKLLGAWGTPFVHAMALLATVVFSMACYRLVEAPWRRRLRGHWIQDPEKDPPGAVAMPKITRPAPL
ncbi:acyltransferase [Hydrogenophaga sp.]|uniref:acyltransferase family protein n=1 Tax=Hydrogenophaga sp. TaxID=1904254 RepID=UPI0027267290|nr:acyltransferase [Hydrogenophaga sp.]MDO9433805.1 acyltransferase [Hydrogenophaga sp.]